MYLVVTAVITSEWAPLFDRNPLIYPGAWREEDMLSGLMRLEVAGSVGRLGW